jgi:CBS domain-containing protein
MYTQRVEDWMSTPPIVVSPTTTIEEAQRLMQQHRVRRLPVVQDGRLVGIVTRGDLRVEQRSAATTLSVYEWRALLQQLTIASCMTHSPITIAPSAPVLDAARQMLTHKIGALPVVAGDRLVGVITETDLLRLLLADETRLAELAVGR